MFSHATIWELIDDLASRNGLTASGLARLAGLDPTAFNKSKRVAADGRLRWPSTESLSKVLDATGASVNELLLLVVGAEAKSSVDRGWNEEDAEGFAEPSTDERTRKARVSLVTVAEPGLPPLYRPGDRLILAPTRSPRPGERVAVRLKDGNLCLGEVQASDGGLRLATPGGGGENRIDGAAVAEIARILWVSQ